MVKHQKVSKYYDHNYTSNWNLKVKTLKMKYWLVFYERIYLKLNEYLPKTQNNFCIKKALNEFILSEAASLKFSFTTFTAVYYFCKNLHLKYLNRFYLALWL